MSSQDLLLWVIMVAAVVAAASAFVAQRYLGEIRDLLVKPFLSARPMPDDDEDAGDADRPAGD